MPTVCSGLNPTLMPLDSTVRSSLPTWKEARSLELSFLNVTLMHSPAAACITSGSSAAATPASVGTKATSCPGVGLGTSTALTAKSCGVAPVGQGLPGPEAAGGRPLLGDGR